MSAVPQRIGRRRTFYGTPGGMVRHTWNLTVEPISEAEGRRDRFLATAGEVADTDPRRCWSLTDMAADLDHAIREAVAMKGLAPFARIGSELPSDSQPENERA